MSKAISLLQDTFPCASAAALVARRVVVFDGAAKGNAKFPAATPEAAIGVTMEKQSAANNISVQIAGVAIVESDGSAVINPGDFLVCDGAADGRVKSQALADGTTKYFILGMCVDAAQIPATAGALVSVRLNPFVTFGA
jgi:hypothetical protein